MISAAMKQDNAIGAFMRVLSILVVSGLLFTAAVVAAPSPSPEAISAISMCGRHPDFSNAINLLTCYDSDSDEPVTPAAGNTDHTDLHNLPQPAVPECVSLEPRYWAHYSGVPLEYRSRESLAEIAECDAASRIEEQEALREQQVFLDRCALEDNKDDDDDEDDENDPMVDESVQSSQQNSSPPPHFGVHALERLNCASPSGEFTTPQRSGTSTSTPVNPFARM
jgi:hypothetical protein